MQHSDERPPTSGRPSLLSLDQQAEADRHRILSSLDNKPGQSAAPSAKSGKGVAVWIAAGVAVLALSAGAVMWLGFVMPPMILNHRYQNMPWQLTIIDGGHLLAVLLVQGLVIGLFGGGVPVPVA